MAQTANLQRRGMGVALVTAMIFGIFSPATRAVYADGGNAVFIIIVTTWVRALSMVLFCILAHERLFPSIENVKKALIGGFFQAASIIGILGGLVFLPGPIVVMIVFTHTLMLLFYMAWRGEIKLNALNVLTAIIALLGLSFVLDVWHKQTNIPLSGVALAFMAALATASRLYVYNQQIQSRHPILIGAENFLVAAVFVSFMAFFKMPQAPASFSTYIYVVAGCTSLTLGSFGMFYGISLIGAFRWSLFLKMEPLFTALFSALLIGEVLKPHQYGGMIIILSSLVSYQILEPRFKIKQLSAFNR